MNFLNDSGIPVMIGPVSDSVLPGMTIARGAIVVDTDTDAWPGDLLHEAGHIALTDPAVRDTIFTLSDDPGEEMGAIAWSWAAAVHLGLEAEVVFHAGGACE
jgi:hypothetical protein